MGRTFLSLDRPEEAGPGRRDAAEPDAGSWGEGAKTALLFLWLLATICAYYILRPVRMALVMTDFGPRMLPWVYMGAALFTGIAVWIYSGFAHLPRRRLLGGVAAFFLSNFAALWWLLRQGSPWLSPVLYVWTDVFSIMSVTLFWMYANDALAGGSAKRTFGRIAAGGLVGAVIGAGLTKALVARLGMPGLVLVSGAVYASTLACLAALERLTGGRPARRSSTMERLADLPADGLGSVARSVVASRTLSLLVLVVALERFVPDLVDYVFGVAMHRAFSEREAYAGAFATFELWRNALVFVGSFFLTAPLLKRLGVHAALVSVPLSIAILGGLYAAVPTLAVAILLKGSEEAQRHAWFKAGKEVVYTATSREVIYKVKAYIEMFVYRLARGCAGLLLLVLTDLLGLGPAGVSVALVPLAAAWCWAAWSLGAAYERSASERPAQPLARESSPRAASKRAAAGAGRRILTRAGVCLGLALTLIASLDARPTRAGGAEKVPQGAYGRVRGRAINPGAGTYEALVNAK